MQVCGKEHGEVCKRMRGICKNEGASWGGGGPYAVDAKRHVCVRVWVPDGSRCRCVQENK